MRACGQGVALALGAGAQQELPHRRAQAHAHRGHVAADELHDVVDGHAGRDRAARRVDVQPDVLGRVLALQVEELGADHVGDLVVDVGAEGDDAVAQQPVVDVGALVGGGVEPEGRGQRCLRHGVRLQARPGPSAAIGRGWTLRARSRRRRSPLRSTRRRAGWPAAATEGRRPASRRRRRGRGRRWHSGVRLVPTRMSVTTTPIATSAVVHDHPTAGGVARACPVPSAMLHLHSPSPLPSSANGAPADGTTRPSGRPPVPVPGRCQSAERTAMSRSDQLRMKRRKRPVNSTITHSESPTCGRKARRPARPAEPV